jgi:hypothetical protein
MGGGKDSGREATRYGMVVMDSVEGVEYNSAALESMIRTADYLPTYLPTGYLRRENNLLTLPLMVKDGRTPRRIQWRASRKESQPK